MPASAQVQRTRFESVSARHPESNEFAKMPEVMATTGQFLVGPRVNLCRCDQPASGPSGEQTVATYIDVSHKAATPPGLEVIAAVEWIAARGKARTFSVQAHDGIDLISNGLHERFVIAKEAFDGKVANARGT